MLTVILAGTGSQLVFPDGIALEPAETEAAVLVKDAAGRVLAVLQRADVSLYSAAEDGFKELLNIEAKDRSSR